MSAARIALRNAIPGVKRKPKEWPRDCETEASMWSAIMYPDLQGCRFANFPTPNKYYRKTAKKKPAKKKAKKKAAKKKK